MAFTRTPGGLAEKWRFHSVPTIWVEGPTDIFFYEPITSGIPCRLEAMHGCGNADALVQALVDHDYPYLVILDGDYRILKPSRSPHRCVIVLARYSFENYLWEKVPVNRACLRHAQSGENKDIVSKEMDRVVEHLQKELLALVALDMAARQSPSPPAILPKKIEPLLADNTRPDVDPIKVGTLIAGNTAFVDPSLLKAAQTEVRLYLVKNSFIHLLKGHLVLGVLKRVFLRAATIESGMHSSLTDDAFTQIIAEMVWRENHSEEHQRLKRNVRAKTRKLMSQYSPATPTTAVATNE